MRFKMSVYVDNARIRYRRMIMSHMLADTYPELMDMALAIGLKHRWLQWDKTRNIPHFDVCQEKRANAIKAGALPVGRNKIVAVMREWRKQSPNVLPPAHFYCACVLDQR